MLAIAVITVSDRAYKKEYEDLSGPGIRDILLSCCQAEISVTVVPDDKIAVQKAILDQTGRDFILTTGGTGLSPRDITPEATREVCDREIPGMAEAMRRQSAAVTPHAMISRAMAGIRGRTLIINLPGSPKGAKENLGVLLPALPHAIDKIKGDESECAS